MPKRPLPVARPSDDDQKPKNVHTPVRRGSGVGGVLNAIQKRKKFLRDL